MGTYFSKPTWTSTWIFYPFFANPRDDNAEPEDDATNVNTTTDFSSPFWQGYIVNVDQNDTLIFNGPITGSIVGGRDNQNFIQNQDHERQQAQPVQRGYDLGDDIPAYSTATHHSQLECDDSNEPIDKGDAYYRQIAGGTGNGKNDQSSNPSPGPGLVLAHNYSVYGGEVNRVVGGNGVPQLRNMVTVRLKLLDSKEAPWVKWQNWRRPSVKCVRSISHYADNLDVYE